eukprot:12142-Heterococcus_DN1.PRE.1
MPPLCDALRSHQQYQQQQQQQYQHTVCLSPSSLQPSVPLTVNNGVRGRGATSTAAAVFGGPLGSGSSNYQYYSSTPSLSTLPASAAAAAATAGDAVYKQQYSTGMYRDHLHNQQQQQQQQQYASFPTQLLLPPAHSVLSAVDQHRLPYHTVAAHSNGNGHSHQQQQQQQQRARPSFDDTVAVGVQTAAARSTRGGSVPLWPLLQPQQQQQQQQQQQYQQQ